MGAKPQMSESSQKDGLTGSSQSWISSLLASNSKNTPSKGKEQFQAKPYIPIWNLLATEEESR